MHCLWTDKDILAFIRIKYPQYEFFYLSLANIKRADFSRYLIMYSFGGVYLDLDMQLKRYLKELTLYENYLKLSFPTFHLARNHYYPIPIHKNITHRNQITHINNNNNNNNNNKSTSRFLIENDNNPYPGIDFISYKSGEIEKKSISI
jgi:hypothetical protein